MFSYAVLLPVAELVLWSAAVLVPTFLLYRRLQPAQGSANARIRSGRFELTLPRDRVVTFSLSAVCEQRFHMIANLNLPGALVGAPVSAAAASYLRQRSEEFSMHTWLTMMIPFFCLPAWWLVGRNIDDLLERRRTHWTILAIGSTLCCAFIVLSIGILTSPPADKRDLLPFLPGAIFWTIAFGLVPLSWLAGRRRRAMVAQ